MAYTPTPPEELKQMVMMGKKRPMNFAYNPGPKEADLMIIHRLKAPDVLGRTAKKEGEGVKVVWGSFEIEGRKFKAKVSKELPGLSKKLRKYLKKLTLSFSVEILDENGNLLEADLEEEDVKQAGAADEAASNAPKDAKEPVQENAAAPAVDNNAAETPTDKPDTAALAAAAKRLRDIQPPIAELGAAAVPLKKASAAVAAMLKGGSIDKAEGALDKIEAGVDMLNARRTAAADAKKEASTAAQDAKGLDPKALVARAGSLKKVIETLPNAGKARKELVQALADLKAKDWAAAESKLTAAEEAVNALAETSPDADRKDASDNAEAPTPAQAKWQAMQPKLQARVDAAIDAKLGGIEAILRAFDYAKSQAEAQQFDSALAAAANTIKLLKAAGAANGDSQTRAQEAADAVPDNAVAYRKTRINWGKTRAGLQAELVKLKMAIETRTRGVQGLEEIAGNADVLFDYVDELDTALEDTLDALLATSDGPEREKLKSEAIRIIGTYRSTLDTDFFKSVDENGFTKTAIRSTALDALSGVETALAA